MASVDGIPISRRHAICTCFHTTCRFEHYYKLLQCCHVIDGQLSGLASLWHHTYNVSVLCMQDNRARRLMHCGSSYMIPGFNTLPVPRIEPLGGQHTECTTMHQGLWEISPSDNIISASQQLHGVVSRTAAQMIDNSLITIAISLDSYIFFLMQTCMVIRYYLGRVSSSWCTSRDI